MFLTFGSRVNLKFFFNHDDSIGVVINKIESFFREQEARQNPKEQILTRRFHSPPLENPILFPQRVKSSSMFLPPVT